MFNNSLIPKNVNLTNILSGVSKGLNIFKKVMPIYEETKPLINTAKKYFNDFKSKSDKKDYKEQANNKPTTNINSPTFFQ